MISIVELLASLIGSKKGKLIGIIVVLGVMFFFVHTVKDKRSRLSKLPVFSMIKSVSFMERLDLVKYESNELLVLGDPDVLQKMIEKAVDDSLEAWKSLKKVNLTLEKAKVEKESILYSQRIFQQELVELQEKADSSENRYYELQHNFKDFLKNANKLPKNELQAAYGNELLDAYSFYQSTLKSVDKSGNHKEKNEVRKEAKVAENDLNQSWLQIKKERYNTWSSYKKTLEQKEKALKHSTNARTLKRLNVDILSCTAKTEEQTVVLQNASQKIKNLKKTIIKNQATTDFSLEVKKPKLLAILPAQTSLYLDLNTVNTKVTKEDSTVIIHIDSLHIDPIIVMVDSSKYYNIAKRNVEIDKENNGLYFEVFEQLQVGLGIIEDRVKYKVQSDHYKQLALKKAEEYFQTLYHALDYEVKIVYGNGNEKQKDVKTVVKEKIPKIMPIAQPTTSQTILSTKPSMTIVPVKQPEKAAKNPQSISKGIDVSHFNGKIDWAQVASQEIGFAYAKATQGIYYKDPMFDINWKGIDGVDINRGAYHFYVPKDNPEDQANFYIKTVGTLNKNDLPPMLDLEDVSMDGVSVADFQSNVLKWLEIIENHYGVQPIIYTYAPYANQYLNNPKFSKYKLWIAEYTKANTPRIPTVWDKDGWYMWQFTSHDQLKGIDGYVDVDKRYN